MTPPPALALRAVTKRYSANVALDAVDFALRPGEIHAVLGENGAGKSTLMHVISGLTRPDAGRIEVNGSTVDIAGPADACSYGIGMVHQHFMLVPSFSVADNLVLAEPRTKDPRRIRSLGCFRTDVKNRAQGVLKRLGWDIPLDAIASDLPVGAQQRVEIVRVLLTDATILLFDEPTAVLAPTETVELFRVLRTLRDDGKSLIFVSHKLSEVMSLCDTVTVLRLGRVVGSVAIGDTNQANLAARMVGAQTINAEVAAAIDLHTGDEPLSAPVAYGGKHEDLTPTLSLGKERGQKSSPAEGQMASGLIPEESAKADFLQRAMTSVAGIKSVESLPTVGKIAPGFIAEESQTTVSHELSALVVEGLCSAAAINAVALSDITFSVRPGEILGFAGVDGNGQRELAEVLTGMRRWTKGALAVGGKSLGSIRTTRLAELGIAYIPPDRHREGLALDLSVEENLLLQAIDMPEFRRGLFLRRKALSAYAGKLAVDFDIRTANLSIPARSLSGGNQQKIVVARALAQRPSLIVAVSPTRGLDVAATAYIHQRLRACRDAGAAVVLISTELDEVIALSDRIAVLSGGRIADIVPADTPRATLGLLMGGGAVHG